MILQGVLGENCKPGDAIAWFLPFLHALATTGTSTYLLGDMVLFSTLVSAFYYFLGHLFGCFFLVFFGGFFLLGLYLFLVKATVHGKHLLLFPVLNFPSCIFVSFVLRVRLHGPGKKNNWQPKWETSSQIGLYLLSFSVYDRERTGWEERLSGKITSNSKSHLDSLTDFLSLSSMLFVCTDQYLE